EFAYEDRAQAAELLKTLGGADALFPDVPAAVEALKRHPAVTGPIGVLGVGFGSVLATKAAGNGLVSFDAGVTIHGGRLEDLSVAVPTPVQLRRSGQDKVLPADLIARTQEAYGGRPEKVVFTYPDAPHGFAVAGRPEFDPVAGELAFERTLAF